MPPAPGPSETLLARDQLTAWRAGWARMMGSFVPGLETLEEMVCRAAETRPGGAPHLVLDLGGGPGVLAETMANRWPGATVTLADVDPVLREIGRQAVPDFVRTVDSDLSVPTWPSRIGAGHDLVTVIMTMHYLAPERAAALYAEARGILAPGGLLVVADVMPEDGLITVMDALNPGPEEAAAELAWAHWWSDLRSVASLRPLFREREAVFRDRPPASFAAPSSWHIAAARKAGFGQAGMLWRCGRHAALAAVA